MTEAEWQAGTELDAMLKHLSGLEGSRKMRLFACGCCRQIWKYVSYHESQLAVEIAEQFADNLVTDAKLKAAHRKALGVAESLKFEAQVTMRLANWAARDAAEAAAAASAGGKRFKAAVVAAKARAAIMSTPSPPKNQTGLLREIIGNPFRPWSADPRWLTSAVVNLAHTMYESRDFGPMPILADALQEAACENADVLAHCRSGGPHVRGCWVVDLVLGKS